MNSHFIKFGLPFLLVSIHVMSQDYEIRFSGSGASQTVDSVLVENLTRETAYSLKGNDILHLRALPTRLPDVQQRVNLSVYPNPSRDFTTVEFQGTNAGHAMISLVDVSGRLIAFQDKFLQAGLHSFSISGLGNGVYIVKITTGNDIFSGRIIATGQAEESVRIRYISSRQNSMNPLKSTMSTIEMEYLPGDLLKITCYSGQFRTVIMDIPTESKTIESHFLDCTDGDSYTYPVVQIGSQVWMAENLKTTHFSNGKEIRLSEPNVEDTLSNFSYYNDSTEFADIYGLFYNWYAIADSNGICPAGWHIPTDAEWNILRDGLEGWREAGGKIKETGTLLWNANNTEAVNSSGFSARPGGFRNPDGLSEGLGEKGQWWSSTPFEQDSAIGYVTDYNSAELNTLQISKQAGFSARCISGTPGLPTVQTGSVYPVELITATSGGTVSSDGGAYIRTRGVCWGIEPLPSIDGAHSTDSSGTGSFKSRIENLQAGVTYHVRAYATNAVGIAYGADSTFTTLSEPVPPVIRNGKVSIKNSNTVLVTAEVVSDGGDPISARGVVWSLTTNPKVDLVTKTDEPGTTGAFSSLITGLSKSVKYYLRTYATNSKGTSYGPETTISIVIDEPGPLVTDVDGNHYQTVYIGDQLWMAENLKTRHFNDGSSMPSDALSSAAWLLLTTPALCYYDNDELNNKNIYGPLYNWYAVADERELCPTGWHIPSNDEWEVLREYLGGESFAGGKMKDIVSGLWSPPNTGADNSSGFTALPGGDRDDGAFGSIHDGTGWWSSTEVNEEDAWSHYLYYSSQSFFPSPDGKVSGCSIRCMKNE
jgi:uncharacterized protein (TIGR02145 family)